MAAAATASLSRDFPPKDPVELTKRPADLGTVEEDKFCSDFSTGLEVNRRPHDLNLAETSTMSSHHDDSDVEGYSDGDSPMDFTENQLSSLMSSNLASSLQAAMDSKSMPEFFRDFDRKRADSEGPDFLSEPPPSKRSKPIPERRRGRPRKEEISENEDLRTVAKRMYARAYRENVSFFGYIQISTIELFLCKG